MKNAVAILAIAGLLWFGLGGAVPHVPIPHVVHEEPLIAGEGLHVLIIADRTTLNREQAALVASSELRGWFNDHHAQWHVWAPNQDTTSEAPNWQAAMQIHRDSLPWLIVSQSGKPNFSGPLPADMDAMKGVLKVYE